MNKLYLLNYLFIYIVAAWLHDVNVIDVTNFSAKIQYTTADCVSDVENLYIELIVKDGSNIVNSTRAPYSPNTRGIFTLEGFQLQPSTTLSYTAQVMYVTTVGAAAIGSFIVTSSKPTTPLTLGICKITLFLLFSNIYFRLYIVH